MNKPSETHFNLPTHLPPHKSPTNPRAHPAPASHLARQLTIPNLAPSRRPPAYARQTDIMCKTSNHPPLPPRSWGGYRRTNVLSRRRLRSGSCSFGQVSKAALVEG